MRKFLLILPLCLWLTLASGVSLDSLWGVWNDKTQPDTNRLKAMKKIAWDGYLFSQPDSAFYFAQLQYELAEATGNKKWMADALNTQGNSFHMHGNYDKALEYYEISLKIYEEIGDKKGMAKSYNNMGNIYKVHGNYAQALSYYQKSLQISEETGDKKRAIAYNNIGLIYSAQGNYEKALKYHEKSLRIREETGNKRGMASSYINIGLLSFNQGNYDKALEYYEISLKIYEEIGDKRGMAFSYNNMGGIYSDQGNYEQALEYFDKSLKIYEEIGAKKGMAFSYKSLGLLSFNQGNYSEAIDLGKKALALAQEVGSAINIKDGSELLYDVYKKTGQPVKALEMYELYFEMRDSLNSIEIKEDAIKLEYRYQYEKEQAIAEAKHQEEMALSAERAKRQKLITYSSGVGLVMVLIFAIFIFNRLQVTRRQKIVIEGQKQIVEEQKKDITDSIQYAENIQRSLLPTEQSIQELLTDSFILFQPKDVVSGDFYWMQHHNGKVYFAACDCTGHGVPGAFMSMIGSSLLDEAVLVKGITRPNEIFFEVRKGFIKALKQTGEAGQHKDGMDAVLCSWNQNGNLEYALAYNPLLLLRKGEILETKPDKQPVGFHPSEQSAFTHHELKLEKGDTEQVDDILVIRF